MKTLNPVKKIFFLLMMILVVTRAEAFSGGGEDTSMASVTDPRLRAMVASVEEMSEPELILLIDSLFDLPGIPSPVIVRIKQQIDFLHSLQPKNSFSDFAVYPANRFYGAWDTRHPFTYGDSLYKADTLVTLDLSPAVSGALTFPFNGPITSKFGYRDTAMHRGIDIDLNRGDKVNAAFDGMVRFAGKYGGFGNVVIVRHYNGLETVYAHLYKIKVKAGDIVLSGQLLGLGGSTGHSTGTHLHFETRFRGVAVNPAYLIGLDDHQLVAEKICLKRTRQGYAAYPAEQELYVVKKGDNLAEIAKRFGVNVRDLKNWNDLGTRWRLKVGEQLRVNAAAVTSK